ncbi:MAG: hypothetical protein AAGD07_00985 [Planctomycetota bacterium]
MQLVREVRIQVHSAHAEGFQVAMERVVERWRQISGLFFEWDGSLTLAQPQSGWECHGNLYDSGERVQYLELQLRLSVLPAGGHPTSWRHPIKRLLLALLADTDALADADPAMMAGSEDSQLDDAIRIQRLPEFQFQSWTEFVNGSQAWNS